MEGSILRMENVTKRFPGVVALNKACIEVLPGEVHALMGENGAGKSTFMKVLNGLLQPDEGEIFLSGEKVSISCPAEAIRLGISMIYQELNPVRDMTVAENIFLGREPTRLGGLFIDKMEMLAQSKALLERFRLRAGPSQTMSTLSVAQMQMIEIIKAVSTGARVIVMDEPTSSLTSEEIEVLFQTIADLKKDGVAVIYISHRMDEIFRICQRVTVLRDGQYIGTREMSDITQDQLIHMMVGREVSSIFPKTQVPVGDVVFQANGISRRRKFQNISFSVRRGEILGFYGLVGAGRSEIFQSVFGLDALDEGTLQLDGNPLQVRRPLDAIDSGVAMVTEDRKEYGLVLCRSILENISLSNLRLFSKGPFLHKKSEAEQCGDIARKLSVKMSGTDQETGNLSGGNQQKVVLSKWLLNPPRLLILDEPTRGIDVGAKAEIYTLMSELALQGMAVVLISSELPEVMGMSDRMIVLGEGRILGEFPREEFDQNEILAVALGGNHHESK